jgi:hypothetical protein
MRDNHPDHTQEKANIEDYQSKFQNFEEKVGQNNIANLVIIVGWIEEGFLGDNPLEPLGIHHANIDGDDSDVENLEAIDHSNALDHVKVALLPVEVEDGGNGQQRYQVEDKVALQVPVRDLAQIPCRDVVPSLGEALQELEAHVHEENGLEHDDGSQHLLVVENVGKGCQVSVVVAGNDAHVDIDQLPHFVNPVVVIDYNVVFERLSLKGFWLHVVKKTVVDIYWCQLIRYDSANFLFLELVHHSVFSQFQNFCLLLF